MPLYAKQPSGWSIVKGFYVKKPGGNSGAWTKVKKGFIKKAEGWVQFWPKSGPSPEEELFLLVDPVFYPSNSSTIPELTIYNSSWNFNGTLTLEYKWQVSDSDQGPWTDITSFATYGPGNPSPGNTNSLSFKPDLVDYVAGRVYFNFVMRATDSLGTSLISAVSDPVTVGPPLWNTQPSFSGTPAVGYTLKWKAGRAYIGGVSDNVGYKTTIYRTNDNGVTKQYLYGTALEPDFVFSDNYEYSFNLTADDVGYSYYASTYSVFSDDNGEKENATRSTIISDNKTVSRPPGAFSIISATKGKYASGTRPISIVWSTSQYATSYEFSVQSSSDQTNWTDHVVYGPSGVNAPDTSKTWNIGSNAQYVRVTMRSTNSSGLYAYTSTVLAVGLAPTAPVITNATSTTTNVTLTFTAPTDNGSSDDIIYSYSYKQSSSGTWSTYTYATSPPDTDYIVQNLLSNTSYDFKIRATNFDQLSSPDSNIVTISTKVAPGPLTNVFSKTFDAGYITTFFTTGTNTSNVNVEYGFEQTQPPRGEYQDFDVPVSSSSSYYVTNTTPLTYTNDAYNVLLVSSNSGGISTNYGNVFFVYPTGGDKPIAFAPTFSGVSQTGFTANFNIGSSTHAVIDLKTGGSSVAGYPKTISYSLDETLKQQYIITRCQL